MTDDPIGDAIHAEAEAARAEIRAAGLTCPSCEVNMADLPEGHALILSVTEPWTAECRDGAVVELAAGTPMSDGAFGTWQSAANISLYDDFRRREREAFRAMGFPA